MPPRATETPAATGELLVLETVEPTAEPEPVRDDFVGKMLVFVQGIFGDSIGEDELWIIAAGVLLIVILIVLLIVVLVIRGRKKNSNYVEIEDAEGMYMGRPDGGSDEGTVRQDVSGAGEYEGGTINRELYNATAWEEPAPSPVLTESEPKSDSSAEFASTGTTRISVSEPITPENAEGTVRINMRRRGVTVNFEESRIDEATGGYIECPARSVTLEREIIVGRLGECDVVIDDMAVSGRHLKITREDGIMMVTDLHSSNGTELNGQKISRTTNLNSGDVLHIGRTALKVTYNN